jgi:hypothetical protein
MTVNQLADSAVPAPARAAGTDGRRRLLTVTGAIGAGYTLSWIAGLAVPAPSPKFGASGAQIVSAFAGHAPALAAQFTLTEGLPAVGIAVVAIALARVTGSRLVGIAGVTAAVCSCRALSYWPHPRSCCCWPSSPGPGSGSAAASGAGKPCRARA